MGVGPEPWHWSDTTPTGVKPLPREQHLMVFNTMRGSTYLFGGSVPEDTTYGPSEFWEYIPNATARDNGAGCTASTASSCKSGNCVDGVCCVRPPRSATASASRATYRAWPGRAATCPPASRTTTPVRATSPATRPRRARRCSAMRARRSVTARAGTARTASAATPTATAPASSATVAGKVGTCSPVPSGLEDPPTCASDDLIRVPATGRGRAQPESGRPGSHAPPARSAPARSASTVSVATPTAPTRATRATRRAPRGTAR